MGNIKQRLTQLLLVVCLVSMQTTAHAEDKFPTVSVQGTAEIRVAPDEGVLTFSLEAREKQLDTAVGNIDKHIEGIIKFLKESKIADRDIKTEVIRINPIYDTRRPAYSGKMQVQQSIAPAPNSAPNMAGAADEKSVLKLLKPVGYKARRQLSIVIKDLATYEDIYRGLLKRGVNEVSGIKFRSSELRKHKDLARKQAVIAAREKANAMAKELGATLASVQTINEVNQSYGYAQNNFRNAVFDGDSSGAGSAIGMIEIKATVSVVFRLGNTELDQ